MANDLPEVLARNELSDAEMRSARGYLRYPSDDADEYPVQCVLGTVARLLNEVSAKGGPIEIMDPIDDARAILAEVLR